VLACINDGDLRAPGEPCPGPNAPGGRGRRQFADFFIGQTAPDLRGRHPLNAIPGHKPQARARPDYDAVQNIPIVVQDPVQRSKGTPGPGDNRCPLLQRRVGKGRPSSFTAHTPCRIWTLGDSSWPYVLRIAGTFAYSPQRPRPASWQETGQRPCGRQKDLLSELHPGDIIVRMSPGEADHVKLAFAGRHQPAHPGALPPKTTTHSWIGPKRGWTRNGPRPVVAGDRRAGSPCAAAACALQGAVAFF
jgi:hypothetical protein